jgi:hypothetical protein
VTDRSTGEHRCQSEKRDAEFQDELNEHGRRPGEEAENKHYRQADRQDEDQEQVSVAKEG